MFTPIETSIGALLLHQATSVLLFQNGTILGASGLMRQLLTSPSKRTLSFFAGMAASFPLLKILLPQFVTSYPAVPSTVPAALATMGIGALVGWGTKASAGCTSGHMLCGLARRSGRSLIAVATFFPLALFTNHLLRPSLLTDACPPGVPCYTPTYPSKTTTVALASLAVVTILAARMIPRLVAKITAHEGKSTAESPATLSTLFLSGLEFALGLQISEMASPTKVLSFLAFPNLDCWDPSMALVILFGVLPNLIEIYTRGFEKAPRFNDHFDLPKKTVQDVDLKFVLGAAAFGIGWGLSGVCPGPAALRTVAQPTWGLLWMSGFWLGGKIVN